MSNLPPSPQLSAASPAYNDRNLAAAEYLVLDLSNPELRENALLVLAKKREWHQDLGPILWNTFGTVPTLVQEIVSIYSFLTPPNLTSAQSNRVCNSLALLQCIASHPDTRMLFLKAQIPLFLYPLLNTMSNSRPFEYLRLTSLGVIGALVKDDDTDVISFLLSTEIMPLCLRPMEMGIELTKTIATFIVQKILLNDVGLDYICKTAERFFAVGRVLDNMVQSLVEQPSRRLLKHIIRCYLRLSEKPWACSHLGAVSLTRFEMEPLAIVFVRIKSQGSGSNSWFTMLELVVSQHIKVEDLIASIHPSPSMECFFFCLFLSVFLIYSFDLMP